MHSKQKETHYVNKLLFSIYSFGPFERAWNWPKKAKIVYFGKKYNNERLKHAVI